MKSVQKRLIKEDLKREKVKAIDMTYILGARCKDGVLIVADKRGTMGNTYVIVDKIVNIKGIGIFASSGTKSSFDRFKRQLKRKIKNKKFKDLDEKLDFIADVVKEVNEKEKQRYGKGADFDIFYAFYNKDKKAELHYISDKGRPDEIENSYRVIGQGEACGAIIMKLNAEHAHEINDFATYRLMAAGYSVIKTIEEFELDTSVGCGVQWCLMHDRSKPELKNWSELNFENKMKLKKAYDDFQKKLKDVIIGR